MKSGYKIVLVGLLAMAWLNAFSQHFEKSSSISRSFGILDDTEIRVNNKYGNIHLITWEKDSVRFEVEISVTSNKQSRLDRTFNEISIDFVDSPQYLFAQTLFQNQSSSFWQDVSDFANIIFKGGTEARIDYTIYLPEKNDLDIELKFGNIYTTDHKGEFRLNLSNGDFKAGKLNGKNRLSFNFGKASLDYFAEGRIEAGYYDLEIDTITRANIISKSSTLILDDIGSIDIDSKRDKFHIGEVAGISGTSSFSYINIRELQNEAILQTNYGDVSMDKIKDAFQMVNIRADYTDIKMGIPMEASFNVDLIFDPKTDLYIPEALVDNENKAPGADGNRILSGVYGNTENPEAVFKAAMKGGSLHLFKY